MLLCLTFLSFGTQSYIYANQEFDKGSLGIAYIQKESRGAKPNGTYAKKR